MKLSELEGKTLHVVSVSPWEILVEEEIGGIGGQKYIIKPEEESSGAFSSALEVFKLKEERLV